jgi:hypothetical protein
MEQFGLENMPLHKAVKKELKGKARSARIFSAFFSLHRQRISHSKLLLKKSLPHFIRKSTDILW